MNNEKRLIQDTLHFIVEQYISKYDISPLKKSTDRKRTKFLTEQEIVELFSKLPFYVADEVIYFFSTIEEIQKEDNTGLINMPGHSFSVVFPFWMISPGWVYDRIENYQDWCEYQSYDLYIIHGDDKIVFSTPVLQSKTSEAPIYYHWGLDYTDKGILCYSSLTNLLLMVAECYKTGAYHFQQSSIGGYWKEDFTKSELIFDKYHPGLTFRSPHELNHFLDD
jgi:hypothetical protein